MVKELRDVVVQKYIDAPCLVEGRKFDIRAFMVVISARPYFVYSHPGYARISLMPYTVENFAEKTNEARMTHLTNLAIQKKHPNFKDLKN